MSARSRFKRAMRSLKRPNKKKHFDREFYRGKEWAQTRLFVLERDNYECRRCGSGDRLEVHHVIPRPRGTDHPSNLRTLCHDCHKGFHKHMRKSK